MQESEFKNNLIFRVIIPGILILSVLTLLFFLPAFNENKDIYPLCISCDKLGIYCPSCGVGRALSCLVHGDLKGAFKLNQLLIIFLPFIFYWYICNILECFNLHPWRFKLNRKIIFIIILVIILYGILRNIPIYPFKLLAPH